MALRFTSARTFAIQGLIKFPPLRLPSPHSLRLRPARNLGFRLRGFYCGGGGGGGSMEGPLVVKERIDLTEKEEKIFRRLLDVVRHFKLETQLRVAGGWVRDKLLGKDCYDIDIALDNMLGREFCENVNEYLHSIGEEQQGIGVIQCNPDQSKHLETARMRIYDIWIDFVNLSLFYNINTDSVEDFTRRGIQDLNTGYIVTPLPPKATFLDDPLRVLRAIRFGARFGFVLDEDLKKAASDEEVRAAIADKISRERIGHEVDLMISGNQPIRAMAYICDLQLFYVVFTFPENPQPSIVEGCDRHCVSYMDAAWNLLQSTGYSVLSDEQRRLYLYGALFLSVRNTIYEDKKSKKMCLSDLDNVWEMKPLLDGKAIMGVLQLKSGGPLIREWQERLIKWQLAYPEGTTEECLDWMKQSQAKRAKLDCCA
ncbi:putative CCA tRNA nucleotidyltransferase 2 [Cocos nucifera]|uniref:Putative CCA tRNA nucleotidyltransferase 2 n=1 Tax=Cocos nucifera TaxID=13894 RepID=A0A8K0IWP8_COCNU|nr:putative CCA tRNA nucleotidyltransferase 2 [Cocos nucifera]